MHRFFVSPQVVSDGVVTLAGQMAHQITHVLRMAAGEHIIILDNSGWQMETELTYISPYRVVGHVIRRSLARGEPKIKVSLYQAMLKGNRLEFALQKGTEIGIIEYVPMITSRCVIANLDDVNSKLERWQRILREAAEQSRRGRLPTIEPAMLMTQACERARQTGGLTLLPWEEEQAVSLKDVLTAAPMPFTISLLVGPEGGFSADEVSLAQSYGVRTISLGPRVLRAETAGLVAASAIFYESGDLEPLTD